MTLLEYFNQQFDLCAKNLMGHTKNPVYYFGFEDGFEAAIEIFSTHETMKPLIEEFRKQKAEQKMELGSQYESLKKDSL